MIKILKTIFPPVVGYLTYLLFDTIFEKFFLLKPISDAGTPGIVILFEDIFYFSYLIFVFVFQYKVIVPKTTTSIYKAIIFTFLLGFTIGLFFLIGNIYIDKATFQKALISFFRVFGQFESFWLTNLVTIAVLNYVTKKNIYKNNADRTTTKIDV